MRRITLLIIVIFVSLTSFGQTLKIQAGPSFSSLDCNADGISMSPYNKTIIGYSFFVGLDYFNTKYFNLSSNLGTLRKGGKHTIMLMSVVGPSVERSYNAQLDYLSVNTLIDLKYPITDKITPYICFGPRLDYLVSFSDEYYFLTANDDLNGLNYGVVLGGGLKYDWSRFQIGIHADYYLNFNNIADWSLETSYYSGTVSDNTFTINLSLGYKL